MSSNITITKRNGHKEKLDFSKIHKVAGWACEGISNVSVSELELKSEIQFYDGMTSEEIQQTLIKSAADLITENSPNYQYVASRLINFDLRKRVYGQIEPLPIKKIVEKNVALGFYEPKLLEWYDDSDWEYMDKIIRHERDYDIVFAGMEQFRGKYLVRNKITQQFYETPQIVYMLIAATGFYTEDKKNRLKYIKEFYNAVSNFDISLPTPVVSGLRTSVKQFASCTLIDVGDSLESINAAASSIVMYASKRAGIGVNVGRIRALGSAIRNGEVTHTGVLPFVKYLIAALKSCNQGGVRAASGTFCYPMWHYEFEDLIVLKNNKGTDENRARAVDYCVQINKTMLKRLVEGGDITLFSPNDVPGLYESYFGDPDKFEEIYLEAEKNPNIRKKTISAMDAFSSIVLERKETGRIYIQFADNTNELGVYIEELARIYMTNLCVEVTQTTKPMENIFDTSGQISLCTLAAYNFGNIKKPEDFEKIARILVRFLDNLLTYQEYMVPAAKTSTDLYRHLGIGVNNLAYFLAKHNQKYTDDSSPEFLHSFMEAMSYYTIKASVELAKERGPCEGYANTKWSKGILPIDKYRKAVDDYCPNNLIQDWEMLRQELKEFGIRNTTLMAIMPSETSSQLINSTNGVEAPRSLVSVKNSKDGALKQVVPEITRLKNKYELLWDQKSPRGYLRLMGVINKFICQSISANTSYNPSLYEDNTISMSELLGDILYAYQIGLRTLYYNNENDAAGEIDIDAEMKRMETPIVSEEVLEDDEYCEACVL